MDMGMVATLRILGIDGGLANMGVAAIQYDGLELLLMGGDVHTTAPSNKKLGIRKGDDNMRRAREQAKHLMRWAQSFKPHLIVYEAQSFGMRGQVAARQAATAFGMIAMLAEVTCCPMLCVSPQAIKKNMKSVTKAEVIAEVSRLHPNISWPVDKRQWEHMADAIAAIHSAIDDEMVRAMLVGPRSLLDPVTASS